MTGHDALISAILARLQAAPVLADVIAEEIDQEALHEQAATSISVAMVNSVPGDGAIGAPVDWETSITIEHHARFDGRTAAGRLSRGLHQLVYQRLKTDASFGGLAYEMAEPRLTSDSDQADSRLGCLIAEYSFRHRSAWSTLAPA